MMIFELIEILKKCDSSAEVHFCYGDNERADVVEFVEFNSTSNRVFFYEDEPTWDNDNSPNNHLELDTVTAISDGFVETTYRVVG